MALHLQIKMNVTSDECAACHRVMATEEMGTCIHCGGLHLLNLRAGLLRGIR
jgi:rRNA maturation endonuclease Nob1